MGQWGSQPRRDNGGPNPDGITVSQPRWDVGGPSSDGMSGVPPRGSHHPPISPGVCGVLGAQLRERMEQEGAEGAVTLAALSGS